MMQAAARRFRQWVHRSEHTAQAHTAPDDDGPPSRSPAPVPHPVGDEDTEPVDMAEVIAAAKRRSESPGHA